MSDQFNQPGSATGIKWDEHQGRLLLFTVKSLEQDINTSFGAKDAIRADLEVLDGPNPERFLDILVFPQVLQGQLRSSIGHRVLGRLGTGNAKPGQKPPWRLFEATDADQAVARAHIAANDPPPF